MNFVTPTALFGMGLALPVLVFYLLRQRGRIKPASTLLFWRQTQPQLHNRPFWKRFRHWLSYLLQVLFLMLLCMALSRPYFAGPSGTPGAFIFVMDASASMQAAGADGETVWEKALSEARRRVRGLPAGRQGMVILVGKPVKIPQGWTANRRLLDAALASARPGEEAAGLEPALELARNLAETAAPAEIYLFTDGVWEDMPEPSALKEARIVPAGPPKDNTGIVSFSARRLHTVPDEYLLSAKAQTSAGGGFEGRALLYRDGQLADARELSIAPGGSWQHVWRKRGLEAGRFSLKLEGTEKDALDADNQASLELEALQTVKARLAGDPNPFLRAVLLSFPGVAVETEEQNTPALPAGRNEGPVCWIYNQTAPPGYFQGQPVILINPRTDGFWGHYAGELEKPLVTEWERDHPLCQHLSLDTVRLRQASRYEPPPGAETWAGSFEHPLLCGRWDGAAPWLLMAFDLERTDLPLRAAFPVLMGNWLQNLRGGRQGASAALPGPAETALRSRLEELPEENPAEHVNSPALIWPRLPLWWWLLGLGALWCLAEWWSYSRRITE